jgi:hypothetical protein
MWSERRYLEQRRDEKTVDEEKRDSAASGSEADVGDSHMRLRSNFDFALSRFTNFKRLH